MMAGKITDSFLRTTENFHRVLCSSGRRMQLRWWEEVDVEWWELKIYVIEIIIEILVWWTHRNRKDILLSRGNDYHKQRLIWYLIRIPIRSGPSGEGNAIIIFEKSSKWYVLNIFVAITQDMRSSIIPI